MQKILFTSATLILAACTAQTSTTVSAGTSYTYAEYQARFGATPQSLLATIDSDADGQITQNEIQAARDDGII
ncbi:MAG: hypothetical protein KJO42_09545 [Silicimonas sp.]|nr:hypothetical protein [Silicimonas sp.]RZV98623.1 MAG: hypothetical protein EX266_16915 [Paracoccaceae bacterium]